MSKLKDHIIKQEEIINANQALEQLVKHSLAKIKHQWREDMPDLEGKALADAEKQFDYDSWLGEQEVKSRYEKCGEVGCSFCDAGE